MISDPEGELEELILQGALEAHARDELGISETLRARPLQAAFASAVAFGLGALVPLLAILLAPASKVVSFTVLLSLGSLLIFGGMAAAAGGASVRGGALRMVVWGAVAMGLTSAAGHLFGVKL